MQFLKENKTPVFTVSKLNSSIRQILEKKYPLIWVEGEISNFKAHSSGHFYFYIKDAHANLRCVMFKSSNRRLDFSLKEGLEVLVCGKITVYERRGDYQISCELIKPKGLGDLHIAFEALKKKLKEEGLFDNEKRKLPFLSKHIVVLTSPTGAAIRDILNVLRRRFRGLRVTLVPALVQGTEASSSLIQGIKKAKRIKDADVLIVTRGGGSAEDLWCFNDEKLVRELYSFPYPVISAVGHEIDFTLSDFVADLRAPTPSAAAELVIKERTNLIEKLNYQYEKMNQSLRSRFNLLIESMRNIHRRLHLMHPEHRLKETSMQCDEWMDRLIRSMRNFLKEKKWQLKKMEESFNHLSPFGVLKRGYAIIKKDEQVVYKGHQLSQGDKVQIFFEDKEVQSTITAI